MGGAITSYGLGLAGDAPKERGQAFPANNDKRLYSEDTAI